MPNPFLNATVLEFLELFLVDDMDNIVGSPGIYAVLTEIRDAIEGVSVGGIVTQAAIIAALEDVASNFGAAVFTLDNLLVDEGAIDVSVAINNQSVTNILTSDRLDDLEAIDHDLYLKMGDEKYWSTNATVLHLRRSGSGVGTLKLSHGYGDRELRLVHQGPTNYISILEVDASQSPAQVDILFDIRPDRLELNGNRVVLENHSLNGGKARRVTWSGVVDGTLQQVVDLNGLRGVILFDAIVQKIGSDDGSTSIDNTVSFAASTGRNSSSRQIHSAGSDTLRVWYGSDGIDIERNAGSGTFNVLLNILYVSQ